MIQNRKVLASISLALCALQFTSASAEPVPDLNTVTIQIAARGQETSPAELIAFTVMAQSDGRSGHAPDLTTLRSVLSEFGIGPEAITKPMQYGFIGNEAGDEPPPTPALNETAARYSMFRITISDPKRYEALKEKLSKAGFNAMTPPTGSLLNDSVAKLAAMRKALRQAETDAAAIATSLNLRIIRLTKVSNSCISSADTNLAVSISAMERLWGGPDPTKVVTESQVCVDFAAIKN